ncbi:hypothetical protein, partial [Agathobacter sp.]|uniref:hypothetical protein n=1 Tax=Agathobacter sp. TaxID=2021311 RepID=UPI00280AE810
SHPWELISVYSVHNSTVSKQLHYSLTRESVHKPVTWSEAPHTVPKYSLEYNSLKKYVSIAIN